MDRYVVKVRRNYGDREFTSLLSAPTSKEKAQWILSSYIETYQSTQYYLEKWEEKA